MYSSPSARCSGCRAGGTLALVLLAGCANTGPPKPPSLHLVKPAVGLTAERVGTRVLLQWTVPSDTTDGGTLSQPLTAAICRDEPASAPGPAHCAEVQRIPVKPGHAAAADQLPSTLSSGAPRLLLYRVELLNPHGRSAGLSAPAYATAGQAPGSVTSFHVDATRNGAVLSWSPAPSGSVQVMRTTPVDASPIAAKPGKKSSSPFGGHASDDRPVTLSPGSATDPGGMVDRTIHDGDTIVYVASRVYQAELAIPASSPPGKDGRREETRALTQSFELRSEPSAPLTFTFHDTIPPSAPSGLAAIPGGGFGQSPSIDLSWEANPESDVVGYNIFRATASQPAQSAQSGQKLNPEPLLGPAWRDFTAIPGVGYVYRVTAIDRRGHESEPSQPLAAQLSRSTP